MADGFEANAHCCSPLAKKSKTYTTAQNKCAGLFFKEFILGKNLHKTTVERTYCFSWFEILEKVLLAAISFQCKKEPG